MPWIVKGTVGIGSPRRKRITDPTPALSGEPLLPLDEHFAMAHLANGSAGKIES